MIWTKGTHQSAKFQIFYCSREFAVNLYFDRLLLLKVYKISGKESTEKLCLMTCGIWQIFTRAFKVSKFGL